MEHQQILIDALYQIACGNTMHTREELINSASEALIAFMHASGIDVLTVTKGINNLPVINKSSN